MVKCLENIYLFKIIEKKVLDKNMPCNSLKLIHLDILFAD